MSRYIEIAHGFQPIVPVDILRDLDVTPVILGKSKPVEKHLKAVPKVKAVTVELA